MARKMNYRVFARGITILCLLLEMFVREGEGTAMSGPKKLAEDLFREYGSPFVRPVKDPNKTVEVYFRAKPVWFADFDEARQTLSFTSVNQIRWTDEYLTWDPDKYNGTEELSVVKKQIWFPDLAASEKVTVGGATVNSEEPYGVVNYKGEIVYYYQMLLTVFCKMDVRLFPLDSHDCTINFSPYSYPSNKVTLYYSRDSEAQENVLKKNGVWFVSDIATEEKLVHYLCCPQPYSEVHYTLHVQRESGFYVLNFGLPTFLLSLTTVAVFLLHPESGEKISLCVNNVLALIIFQQLLAASMPPTGDQTPIVAYYFVVVITISFLSVLTTSLTLGMYHHTGSRPLPKLLRIVILMKASGHQQSSYSRVQDPKKRTQTNVGDTRHQLTDMDEVELSPVTKLDVEYPDNNVDGSARGRLSWRSPQRGRNAIGAAPGLVPVDISENDVTGCVTDMSFQEEWKKAARRIDKCLFYISLAAMIAAVIFCLFEFMVEKRKE